MHKHTCTYTHTHTHKTHTLLLGDITHYIAIIYSRVSFYDGVTFSNIWL